MRNQAACVRLQVSGFRCQEGVVAEKTYLAVEDLDVYRKLCQLHLEVYAQYGSDAELCPLANF